MTEPDRRAEPAPRPPSRPVGWWLKEADARLEAAFDLGLRAYGITSRRGWQILASTARAPIRRRDLIDDLANFDSPRSLEQLVDEMVAEGWLVDDAGVLGLTADGSDLHHSLTARVAQIRNEVAEALPGEDYETLIALLRRLVDAFPPVPDEPPVSGRR